MDNFAFKKGLSINALKYIAIAAMLIDHIAIAFVEYDTALFRVMDCIGRITGPVMFFAAVEGYHHTRSLKKYLSRLLLFAIISYLPFMYAFHDGFNPLRLNVLFTIFIGLIAVHARRTIKNIFLKIPVLFLLLVISIPTDYGSLGVMIILVFDFFYGNLKNQLAGYTLIVLLDVGLLGLLLGPFFSLVYEHHFDISRWADCAYEIGFLLPLVLLSFYNGEKGKTTAVSKWGFYVFYPVHLLIIGCIRMFLL